MVDQMNAKTLPVSLNCFQQASFVMSLNVCEFVCVDKSFTTT